MANATLRSILTDAGWTRTSQACVIQVKGQRMLAPVKGSQACAIACSDFAGRTATLDGETVTFGLSRSGDLVVLFPGGQESATLMWSQLLDAEIV